MRSCSRPSRPPAAEIIEQILVKVNGEIFTKTDLEQRQVAALRQKGQQIDLKSDRTTCSSARRSTRSRRRSWWTPSTRCSSSSAGKELGYKLSDEQFKSVVDNIKKENKIETDEQFQAALKAENMTMADLRRNLERQMISQRVQQNEVLAKIGVTDDEARKYYESHLKEFTTPPTVTLREILVAVPGDPKVLNVGADEAAKEKAEAIRKRVTAGGENFEKLAAEISDSPSKANAGLIGPLSVNDISPDLRKLIESMKPGDVSRARSHTRAAIRSSSSNRSRRPRRCRSSRRASRSASACSPTSARPSSRSTSRSCGRRRSSSGRIRT